MLTCRCPRLALSSSYGAFPRPSGSLCVQSETNRSKFFLVKAILSTDSAQSPLLHDLQWGVCVANCQRHSNAQAASGIQCVLDFLASHDSQCSIVFHTASRCCFPLYSAGHGCLVASVGHRVRGHRYCLWCRNRCVPQRRFCRDGMFIAFCAHFLVKFSPCTAGKKTREGNPTLVSSPTRASLRYSSFCAAFKPCTRLAEQNEASLCSR